MKFVFFDGTDTYDFDGQEIVQNNLNKDDVILMAESQYKTFNQADEANRNLHREQIGAKEFSTLIADSGQYSTIFSIPFEHHQLIRKNTKAIICEASFALTLAAQMNPNETLITVIRVGDFAYTSLWVEGRPLEESFIVIDSLDSTLENSFSTILGESTTTDFRIISNLESERFSSLSEKIPTQFNGSELIYEYIEISQLFKQLLSITDFSEYITQEELQSRIAGKIRRRNILSLLTVLLISTPSIAYAGFQFYQQYTLNQTLTELTSQNTMLLQSVKLQQTLKGAYKYYNKENQFRQLLLLAAKYEIDSGNFEKQGKVIHVDLVTSQNETDAFSSENHLNIIKHETFLKNKDIKHNYIGEYKTQ